MRTTAARLGDDVLAHGFSWVAFCSLLFMIDGFQWRCCRPQGLVPHFMTELVLQLNPNMGPVNSRMTAGQGRWHGEEESVRHTKVPSPDKMEP